jgi:anti-sigma regulatory factor (Ser/Thr protein kinase)
LHFLEEDHQAVVGYGVRLAVDYGRIGLDVMLALEIPPLDEFVGLTRHLVGQAASHAEIGDDRVDDARLCVSEIVSNALDAQRRVASDEPVRVEIDIGPGLSVTVLDRGDGCSLDAASIPSVASNSDEHLGLLIMTALADRVTIAPRFGGGTMVTFEMSGVASKDLG